MSLRTPAACSTVIAIAAVSIVGAAAGQRLANAPPLIPVRLDAVGSFRIAPP